MLTVLERGLAELKASKVTFKKEVKETDGLEYEGVQRSMKEQGKHNVVPMPQMGTLEVNVDEKSNELEAATSAATAGCIDSLQSKSTRSI